MQTKVFLYKCFTYHYGFNNLFKEFLKVSKQGRPVFKDKIWKLLIKHNEARYILNPKFIKISPDLIIGEYIGQYNIEDFINNEQFELFFGPKRAKNTILTEDHLNNITSFVSVIQSLIIDILNQLFIFTKNENLCLNTDFYGFLDEEIILRNTPFKSIYFGQYEAIFEDIAMGAAMSKF